MRGLFGRGEPKVPPLVPVPPIAELPEAKLQTAAKYLGTLDADGRKVVGQGLAARSSARLSLSATALDVVRIAGSFRVPAGALRGAREAGEFAGKAIPNLLLVRWSHEGNTWETGFRLEASRTLKEEGREPRVGDWVRALSKMARLGKPATAARPRARDEDDEKTTGVGDD